MIIGLTGKYASGKTAVAQYLEAEKGFIHLSFSGLMAEECEKQGKPTTRENLIAVANEKREHHGSGYWAKKIIKKIKENKNYVVESVRNPVEIEELSAHPGFILVAVIAPQKIRFERVLERGRVADNMKTLERFRELEARESKGTSVSSQQLDVCIKMAKYTIENSGSKEALFEQIDALISREGDTNE